MEAGVLTLRLDLISALIGYGEDALGKISVFEVDLVLFIVG